MRWCAPRAGDDRVRSGFICVPRCAYGGEWRWLERATWTERYDGHIWRTVVWLEDDRFTITEAGKAYLEGKK